MITKHNTTDDKRERKNKDEIKIETMETLIGRNKKNKTEQRVYVSLTLITQQ